MNSLILASASAVRAQILRNAGVPHTVYPAQVDEEAVRTRMQGAPGRLVAERLAELKAVTVSTQYPQHLVLGADQVLEFDGALFSKAPTLDAARAQLRKLRGAHHQLIGTLVLARDGAPLWYHTDVSTLWVRNFSEAFLEAYLEAEGNVILGSVGCYRYEGLGAQLFDRVEGDYFSILGLSLLPLLAALRDHGVIPR